MKEKINKNQLLLALTAVCLVGLIGVGISYAYYVANFQVKNPENGNNNVTSASTTNVVMDIKSKTVAFDGVLPGHKEVKAFTIRGEGAKNAQPTEASIKVMPNLGVFSNDVTWKLYKSTEEITCTSTQKHVNGQYYEDSSCNIPSSATLELIGSSKKSFKNIIVYPKTETKYYLVVEYANQGNQNAQQGKSYNINLNLDSKQVSINEKIIAQLDITGKCPTVSEDGSIAWPDGESTNGYLCSAPDAYGTSYYYRGTVDNNYVLFAGKYWRIVRVNGDGSMRIIYDGTVAHANGESSNDRHIGTTAFNSNYDDNTYVGYMYGTPNSSTYTETHANINDSTIKKYLDNWYEKNIRSTEYEQYLADNLFCNDRSIDSGTGAGKDFANYRWSFTRKTLLTCPQSNDAFTVRDTTNGNGALKYPIGLLTADEFWLAGGGGSSSGNSKFYLYTGQYEWFMSPSSFFGVNDGCGGLHQSNTGSLAGSRIDANYGARAVLNLRPGLMLQGTGTMEDPYRIDND